jgi:hypothetical protein
MIIVPAKNVLKPRPSSTLLLFSSDVYTALLSCCLIYALSEKVVHDMSSEPALNAAFPEGGVLPL